MSSTEILLSWNEHHGTLISVFEKLLEKNSLVDCTVAAEGQYLKAHKIVLSACSPYFELLFNQENEKNPIVVLKDVKFQELKAIIDFVYRGHVKVSEERLSDFVQVAESLQIKGLGSDLKKNVSAESSEVHVRKKRRHFPSARKRKRSSDISSGEESVVDLPQVTDVSRDKNSENPSQPSSLLQQALLSPFPIATPLQPDISSSPLSSTISVGELSPVTQTEARRIKIEPGSPTAQTTDVSCEALPDIESGVKTELEPIAQIFLPETECADDSKNRLCAVEMSPSLCREEDEEVIEDSPMLDDQSSNQYAGAAAQSPPTPRPARPYGCADCGKSYPTAFQLKCHRRVHGEGPFACRVCGQPCAHLSNLKAHVATHSAERPFKCGACGKGFALLAYRRRHERTHSAERPHGCTQCGHSFRDRAQLAAHARVHAQQKLHRCTLCPATFRRQGEAREHMLVHTGERPYRCGVCGLAFNNRGNLHRHRRTVHATAAEGAEQEQDEAGPSVV